MTAVVSTIRFEGNMKKLIAALVAAMFTLGTGAAFAADAMAKPSVAKKMKKMKKAKAAKAEMKKEDVKK
jgi:hypothetical protein